MERGERGPTGYKSLHEAECFVEITVFDDDGPEGFFLRKYFVSSFDAASWFVTNFDADMHCTITQTLPEQ